MTPADILQEARYLLNDLKTDPLGGAVTPRQSDDELLSCLTEAVGLAMMVRPEVFLSVVEFSCSAGALQSVPDAVAQALIDVQRIKNGAVVLPMNKAALDVFNPGWVAGAVGSAQQWSHDGADPRAFWLYPPAADGQVLQVKVLPAAPAYSTSTMNTDMALPGWMMAPLVSFVVGRAETKDDEHVNSGRAAAMNSQFAEAIRVGMGA